MNPLPTNETKVRRSPPGTRSRGYIEDFGAGRLCRVSDCKTVLSRYHAGSVCWVHDDNPPKR